MKKRVGDDMFWLRLVRMLEPIRRRLSRRAAARAAEKKRLADDEDARPRERPLLGGELKPKGWNTGLGPTQGERNRARNVRQYDARQNSWSAMPRRWDRMGPRQIRRANQRSHRVYRYAKRQRAESKGCG